MKVPTNQISLLRFRFAVPHDIYAETFEGDELHLNASEHKESRESKEETHREPRRAGSVRQVRLAMKGLYPDPD